MLTRRIIPCLDVTQGRVVKGVNFVNLKEIGDPIEMGKAYMNTGADELVYLDITATPDSRPLLLNLIEKIAQNLFIPFTIGGGISTLENMKAILKAGADKISINTAAVFNPDLIKEGADIFGSQCIVVAVDVKKQDNGWKVFTHGGRKPSGLDVLAWIAEIEDRGAGEILLTSMDQDGTKSGFDVELYKIASEQAGIPIIASGGGGTPESFIELFLETEVTAALAASIFHHGTISVNELKRRLKDEGIPIRLEVEK